MIKLFTHTDLDGIGCAVLLKHSVAVGNLDIEYCDPDDVEKKIKRFIDNTENIEDWEIFITDISVSEKFAKILDDMENVKITLIDHHGTALGLNKFSWCHVCIEKFGVPVSGTELFYDYLKMKGYGRLSGNNVYEMTKLIGDWDTWRWKENGNTDAKDVNNLFHMINKDEFIDWCLRCLRSDSYFPNFTKSHMALLDYSDNEFAKYLDLCRQRMFTIELYGYLCGVVYADRFISELGNKLCELNSDIDFVAMIDPNAGLVSFRTIRDDINLGKDIAAKFGGGGHAKAAGCQFSPLVFHECARRMFGG